jgi:hypothetical protein
MIRVRVPTRLQPSRWAASSTSLGMEEKKPCRIQTANARLNAELVRMMAM